ncbi:hypothetical protein Hdeb2414_s0069g00770711 [Helianthus debilis subsp. tardiflorus]
MSHFTSAFELSPHHANATGTSKPTQPEGFAHRSPLAPLFADAILFTYVPKWKTTHSLVIGTPEAARDFLSHAVPPSHRFMNSALRDDLFEDLYSMSLRESFFRGASMLQRINDLRRAIPFHPLWATFMRAQQDISPSNSLPCPLRFSS